MLNSRINLKIAVIILGIAIIGALILIQNEYSLTKKEIDDLIENQFVDFQYQKRKAVQEETVYIINKGNEDVLYYEIVPSEDSTVFSLLEELSQRENFELESTLYEGMGVFVESIDGLRNGTQDKYWQYWVNNELPQVAADKMQIKKNDVIEWRFEASTF
ncbi:MAG: DUF4430 domain-containing protein [Candidatus Nealsonbacteria bacterium]